MKNVSHLAIIAQPAIVDGKSVSCPHCNQSAQVREDGSIYCLEGSLSFAPESTDGELFAMRQAFDRRHGIGLYHRQLMVPLMLVTSGFSESDGRFHPELSDAMQRVAEGGMFTGGMNRVYA